MYGEKVAIGRFLNVTMETSSEDVGGRKGGRRMGGGGGGFGLWRLDKNTVGGFWELY